MVFITVVVVSGTDPSTAFKIQHMNWREPVQPHAGRKFHFSEDDLFKQLCLMDPMYERRPERMDVIFRSGDIRSTLDDRLMEKASRVRNSALVRSRKQRGAAQCNALIFPVSWCARR